MTSTGGYGDLAGEYDTLLGALAEQTWRRGVLAELTRLGVATGTVVDLGAGTGIGGRLLATTCSARRVGVDQSAAMLQVAAGWYEQLMLGDLTRLPLRTGSADLVVSGFDTLNYLEPHALRRCLGETSRCLTPRGLRQRYPTAAALPSRASDAAALSAAVSAQMSRMPRASTGPEVAIRRELHRRRPQFRVNLLAAGHLSPTFLELVRFQQLGSCPRPAATGEKLAAARPNNRFLDKRIANLEAQFAEQVAR